MEEESEMEEGSEDSEKEEKDYSREDMINYMINDCESAEECEEMLEKYGFDLVKKEEEKGPSTNFKDIEKEMGMGKGSMPQLSVIRISSARKALGKGRKK
tara:strand:+ start:517 stop:816 length:300 start_codon:yes stop_codon:yes gene_type:complete